VLAQSPLSAAGPARDAEPTTTAAPLVSLELGHSSGNPSAMASRWHILPLERRPGCVPPLLVKYSIDTKAGYNVYLTDLTYVWSEVLGRRQIIARGLEEDTSIDPSEDASQLQILLEKVQVAFEGAEGTFLELLPRKGGDGLVLRANAALPSPLRPLVWQIYLDPSPPQVLTEMLVLPLLGYHLALRDEVESLVRQVKSKDHVIGKLMDKVELSGMDISSIFPGIVGLDTGKKGDRREKAGKLVRGLGPFNEGSWMGEMKARARASKSGDEVIETIFGSVGAGPFAVEDREITKVGPINKWWQNIDTPLRGQNAGPKTVSTTARRNQPPESGSDDEFQVSLIRYRLSVYG
jgi:XLF-Cernunnos, XRcc4-like factor, NHEJ component